MNIDIQNKKLSDLHPFSGNPRSITDKAFRGLGKSIERFGMLAHIVWNKRTGNIVGGHQRYRQLLDMGETETDVIVVDLDDNEEVALNITLNNKEVRGDFTAEVIDQLRMSEAQLGSSFKAIGLLDMYQYLQSRGFAKKEITKTSPKSNSGASGGKEEDDDNKPQVVITCPKCQSQWKLKDSSIVYNALTGTGKKVGVETKE